MLYDTQADLSVLILQLHLSHVKTPVSLTPSEVRGLGRTSVPRIVNENEGNKKETCRVNDLKHEHYETEDDEDLCLERFKEALCRCDADGLMGGSIFGKRRVFRVSNGYYASRMKAFV